MKKLVLSLLFGLTGGVLLAGPLGFEKSEYSARRQKMMDQIPDGFAIIRNSTGNKPNLDFLYLCGVKVPNAVLLVDGKKRESHRSEWDGRLNREQQFVKVLKDKYPGLDVRDCSQLIWDLRMIKSPAGILR